MDPNEPETSAPPPCAPAPAPAPAPASTATPTDGPETAEGKPASERSVSGEGNGPTVSQQSQNPTNTHRRESTDESTPSRKADQGRSGSPKTHLVVYRSPITPRQGTPSRSGSVRSDSPSYMRPTTASSRHFAPKTEVINRMDFSPKTGKELAVAEAPRIDRTRGPIIPPERSTTPRRPKEDKPKQPTSEERIPLSAYSTFGKASPGPSAWALGTPHQLDIKPAPEDMSVEIVTQRPQGPEAARHQRLVCAALAQPKRPVTPLRGQGTLRW